MHHAFGHIRAPLLSIALAAMLSFLALACGDPSSDSADSRSDTSVSTDRAASARQAPLFKLPNANAPAGTEVSLSQFKNSGPVVLVFYRAHW